MIYFTYILLLLFISCHVRINEKEYKFTKVGWTLKVPLDLEITDSLTLKEINADGQKLVEKTYDTDIDISATSSLISFKKGSDNVFSSSITSFDTVKDGNWIEHVQFLKEIMVNTLKESTADIESIKMDTSTSVKKIDNLFFNRFKLKLNVPYKKIIHLDLYSLLRRGYDFGITIVYQDEKVGKRFYKILRASKFD